MTHIGHSSQSVFSSKFIYFFIKKINEFSGCTYGEGLIFKKKRLTKLDEKIIALTVYAWVHFKDFGGIPLLS